MGSDLYTAAWEELTSVQATAAEWGDGPLLVLAGPGSGKTRVLTCRIARILADTRGQNFRILALTFTNAAASEMRNRVAALVPGEAERVFLGTFHSFCADVLRRHGTVLGINPNFQIYSQIDDLQVVLDKAIRGLRDHFAFADHDRKTLPLIQKLKSRLVFPEDCGKCFKDQAFAEQVGAVYLAYERGLADLNALDFDSLILRTYELLTRYPAFAKRTCVVYPYMCVDEFQDTNSAQYQLIRALTWNQHDNVFVVADDDQIIYQWNGASHKRLLQFRGDYGADIIQLPVNYRCPSTVVRLANSLISHNLGRMDGKQPLLAFHVDDDQDVVRLLNRFPEVEEEAAGIADDIKARHSGELEAVLVLGRSRRLLDIMHRTLNSASLKAVICQRKDEFESTPLAWLHSLLRLANNRSDRRSLEAVAGTFGQLTGVIVDVDEAVDEAASSNGDYLRNWLKLATSAATDSLTTEMVDEVSSRVVQGGDFLAFCDKALIWFDKLIGTRQDELGEQSAEVFAGYDDERDAWQELVREITMSLSRDVTLEAFLQELDMRSKECDPGKGTVRLMTIHGAKGKEADHVYLVGLVEDELPSFQSKRSGETSAEMEEERRNCFVAITRTRKTLTLSYANKYRGWSKQPSRFLYEMGLLS